MPKALPTTDDQMDLAGLSEEERAALADDDETGTGSASDKGADDKSDGGAPVQAKGDDPDVPSPGTGKPTDKSDGGASDQGKKDDDKADADADADKAKTDDKAEDDKPKTDDKAEDDDKAADDDKAKGEDEVFVDTFRPNLSARAIPEELTTLIEANTTAIDALDKQLDDGDIDYAAHSKANRALVSEMTSLQTQMSEAEFVAANNEMTADQHWSWEVERFVEENVQFKNPVIYGALRGALENLYSEEENAGKPYRWFLKEAARGVNEAFNLNKPTAVVTDAGDDADTGKDKDDADADAAKTLGKAVDEASAVANPPKTLGGLPEAEGSDVEKDPFAKIDDLQGMELEAALAKMSDADQKRYLDTRNY